MFHVAVLTPPPNVGGLIAKGLIPRMTKRKKSIDGTVVSGRKASLTRRGIWSLGPSLAAILTCSQTAVRVLRCRASAAVPHTS